MSSEDSNWREDAYPSWSELEIESCSSGAYLELCNDEICLATKLDNDDINELIEKLRKVQE